MLIPCGPIMNSGVDGGLEMFSALYLIGEP